MKLILSVLLLLSFNVMVYSQDAVKSKPVEDKSKTKLPAKYDDDEWDSYFLPGVEYHTYFPTAKDTFGYYSGISIEYCIYSWIYQNEEPGPSHGRIYAKVNVLNSSKKNVGGILSYTMGLDLSLERNPKRKFMIPCFGLEVGGLNQKDIGNMFQITPTFGVHLYSARNLFINLIGGYVYPVKHFEELRGYIAQVGFNFSLW